jgi:hypothetical protein
VRARCHDLAAQCPGPDPRSGLVQNQRFGGQIWAHLRPRGQVRRKNPENIIKEGAKSGGKWRFFEGQSAISPFCEPTALDRKPLSCQSLRLGAPAPSNRQRGAEAPFFGLWFSVFGFRSSDVIGRFSAVRCWHRAGPGGAGVLGPLTLVRCLLRAGPGRPVSFVHCWNRAGRGGSVSFVICPLSVVRCWDRAGPSRRLSLVRCPLSDPGIAPALAGLCPQSVASPSRLAEASQLSGVFATDNGQRTKVRKH